MSVSYWKMAGENIARGLGEKTIRRFSTGGKLLGRTGAVVGIGFLVYELFKNYKDNIENEPAYKEMMILQREMEKWTSAISCIGREPLEGKAYGSFDEGGAINASHMAPEARSLPSLPAHRFERSEIGAERRARGVHISGGEASVPWAVPWSTSSGHSIASRRRLIPAEITVCSGSARSRGSWTQAMGASCAAAMALSAIRANKKAVSDTRISRLAPLWSSGS